MNISINNHCCTKVESVLLVQFLQRPVLGFKLFAVLLAILALMGPVSLVPVLGEPVLLGAGSAIINNSNNKTISPGKSKVLDECKAFTHGISKYEFTSPLYPNHYPDNIDCVKLITAEPGHRIQIQIIESFQMEESPGCKYDYFETRNGQFGYSTELARICGNIPPTPILGLGHYMWLRFHSDAAINYGGFKALITMVPSNDFTQEVGECEQELTGDEGDFKSDDLMAKVPLIERATTCAWIIETTEDKKISLKFPEYKLEKPNDCSHNFVEVYRSKDDYDGRATEFGIEKGTRKFCGSTADTVKSIQNFLAVRFFAVGFKPENPKRPIFHANFTIFREIKKDANPPEVCDPETEFNCGDLTCIAISLKCNNKYNCDLRTDEDEKCPRTDTAGITPDILVIGLVGCLLICGMCAGLVLNIYRKLKQDREELTEQIDSLKKSRESVPESNRLRLIELVPCPSSLESGESKETVIERKPPSTYSYEPSSLPASAAPPPFYPPFPPKNPTIPPNGDLKHQQFRQPKSPPKHVNTVNTVALITYSPPPSYPSKVTVKSKSTAQVPVAEAGTGTDDFSPAASIADGDGEERIIEVRDVACQTRGLNGVHNRDNFGYSRRRAPLARDEAVYELLPVQRRITRRYAPDALVSHPSFSSASSETGRSLERLDELLEQGI